MLSRVVLYHIRIASYASDNMVVVNDMSVSSIIIIIIIFTCW